MQRIVVLSVLGFSGCGHTAPPAPPTSHVVPPSLAFYVGTWQCDGTGFDETGKPTDRTKLEIRVASEIDNWVSVEVFENGHQLTSELKGVDAKGGFHHLWTSTDGSSGSLSSAAGWKDNTIVFDEDHPLPTEKARMTFAKTDDTHYAHRMEVDSGHGYQLVYEKSCRKA